MRHELVKPEALIDWDIFEREWLGFFPSHTGRPATPPRLVAGLCSLQLAFAIKARTKLIRSHKGRPFLWEILRMKPSGQIIPSAITKRW